MSRRPLRRGPLDGWRWVWLDRGPALSDAWAKGALIFYDGARPHRWTELQWRHLTTRWRYGVALRTTQS